MQLWRAHRRRHYYPRRAKNVGDIETRVIRMDRLGDHLIGRRVDHVIGVRVEGGTRMPSAKKRRKKSYQL
jgi:hypothetical protein